MEKRASFTTQKSLISQKRRKKGVGQTKGEEGKKGRSMHSIKKRNRESWREKTLLR